MTLVIIESAAVQAVGACLARQGDTVVIVIDPALSEADKKALIEELTGE